MAQIDAAFVRSIHTPFDIVAWHLTIAGELDLLGMIASAFADTNIRKRS
jgi:hypothetical protein